MEDLGIKIFYGDGDGVLAGHDLGWVNGKRMRSVDR